MCFEFCSRVVGFLKHSFSMRDLLGYLSLVSSLVDMLGVLKVLIG